MSILVTFNGTQYSIPTQGESGWQNLTAFLTDLANNATTVFGTNTATNMNIQFQDGTALLPSLSFTTDNDTGIFHPAAGQLAIATNGAQQVLVDQNGVLFLGTGGTGFTGAILQATGTSSTTRQASIQNVNATGSASTDFVATADNGTDTTNYVDLGINSSTYNDPAYTVTGAGDAYLYAQSSNLALGTATAAQSINLFTGGTLAANKRLIVSDTNVTSAVQLIAKGTATNDNAAAGNIGEHISSNVLSPGSTLTTNVVASVTSISLTAGDWDVRGSGWFAVGTGGATALIAGIYTSVAVPPDPSVGRRSEVCATLTASLPQILNLAPVRFSLAITTTIYLIAQATFPSGTTTGYGSISARRIR